MIPKDEYLLRLSKLREFMARKNIGLTVIANKSNMIYFAGTDQAILMLIPLDGNPLLVARYAFGDELCKEESWIQNIEVLRPYFGLSIKESNKAEVKDFLKRFARSMQLEGSIGVDDTDLINMIHKCFKGRGEHDLLNVLMSIF